MIRSLDFRSAQRLLQKSYFSAEFEPHLLLEGYPYRLGKANRCLNLSPSIREKADGYFRSNDIQWHTHANNALSSQVCCVNFLMPLAEMPNVLAQLVQEALGGDLPTMLPVEEGPDGRPWYVGFEWIGGDYLNEADVTGMRTRGANVTSADAVLRFERGGRTETLLIEWKYTERYGAPIPPKGNPTRLKRYGKIVFAPNGPIRPDLDLKLEDFFFEPFYQLLRQQMLAFQMERHREQGADRVRVLHIAPAANLALHKVTSPPLRRFGSSAFTVFKNILVKPSQFVSRSTEGLFGPLIVTSGEGLDWARYLSTRYSFIERLNTD
jgi:hypothetical protein